MGNVCVNRDDPEQAAYEEYLNWLDKVRAFCEDDDALLFETSQQLLSIPVAADGLLDMRREVYMSCRQLLTEYHCDGPEHLAAERVLQQYAQAYPRLDAERFKQLLFRLFQQIQRNLHRKVTQYEARAFAPQDPGAQYADHYAPQPYGSNVPAYAMTNGSADGMQPAYAQMAPPPMPAQNSVPTGSRLDDKQFSNASFGQAPYSAVAEPPVQDSDDEGLFRVQATSFNSVTSVPSTVAARTVGTGTYESIVVTEANRPPPPPTPQAENVGDMKAILMGTGLRAGVYNQSRVVEPKRLRINTAKTNLSIIDDAPGALEDVQFGLSDCTFLEMGYRNEMVSGLIPRPPENLVAAFRFRTGSLCIHFYFPEDAELCAKALKQLCNLPTLSDPA